MDFRALIAGVSFAVIWSSAFTSSVIIVETAPPVLILALRFSISGTVAILVALWLGQSWRLTPGQWRGVVIFGICQNALYLGLNFMAMQWIEASLAAIIASTMPLLVAFAGWAMLGQRLPLMGMLGLLAGCFGAALILGLRFQGGADVVGVMLCVIAVISLTIATLAMRGAMSGTGLLMIVGLQMWVGALVLWPVGILFESWTFDWTPRLIAAFSYTTIMPGLVATLIWFWLVRHVGAVKAAAFHFLTPVFGVAIAALMLGEAWGLLDVVGVVIVTLGILAVQLSRQSET